MADQKSTLFFNGIHAGGGYLHAPQTSDEVARAVVGARALTWAERELGRSRGPVGDVNALDLASAGWE